MLNQVQHFMMYWYITYIWIYTIRKSSISAKYCMVHARYKWIHSILFHDFQVVTRRVWTMNFPHVKMSFFLLSHMLTLKSVFFSFLHQLFYTFKSSGTSACYFSSKSPGHFICWSKINQAVLFTKWFIKNVTSLDLLLSIPEKQVIGKFDHTLDLILTLGIHIEIVH